MPTPLVDPPRAAAFTWRGFLVGALLALFVGIAAPYAEIVLQGSFMALNSSSPGAIFLFFLFTSIINVLLGLLHRRLALGKADLVLIYIMLLLASAVPTQAFVGYLIPVISGLSYYSTPENNWGEIFAPYVTPWLAPQNYKAIKDLHEGLPAGETIPWGAWAETLSCWYLLFIALSLMMFCMNVILHRQWSSHERLAYPMVQLPLAMLEEGERPLDRIKPFFRNKVMWLGFAVPFVLFSMTGLHHYDPIFPSFRFFITSLFLFRRAVEVYICFSFAWVGFFYLVNLDITFSIWFFYLLSKVQEGIFSLLGIASTEQLSLYAFSQTADLTHQSTGACLVFVLFSLWMARHHLRAVWRKAWHGDPAVDDSHELIPYRLAVLAFLGSLTSIAAWLWASGIPLIILPLFLAACVIFYVFVTRVVATAGVATARAPEVAAFFVISGVGTSVIGNQGLVALTFTYVWQSEMRLFPMIAMANGLKLAEAVRVARRPIFWAAWVALLCSLAGATWIILSTCYGYGGINLHPFFMTHQAVRTYTDMARPLLNPTAPDGRGWLFTGIGGLVEGLLVFAQHRFYWWPLHPVGFPISVGWLTGQIWFSVFVSWLLKLVILKYGGIQLFRGARPFFLGLIVGEATVAGFWLVVDRIMGEQGNMISAM